MTDTKNTENVQQQQGDACEPKIERCSQQQVEGIWQQRELLCNEIIDLTKLVQQLTMHPPKNPQQARSNAPSSHAEFLSDMVFFSVSNSNCSVLVLAFQMITFNEYSLSCKTRLIH